MMKTVLVPLDGSALAERALPYALRLAQAMTARLLLLHATSDLALLTRLEAEFEMIVNWSRTLRRCGGVGSMRTPERKMVSHCRPSSRWHEMTTST